MRKGEKRGQTTIFVIVAIVIVAVVIIFFTLTNTGKNIIENTFGTGEIDPQEKLKTCLETNKEVQQDINNILLQGGSLNPEHYFLYGNTEVEYLCYTNEYFKTCVMQEPLIIQNVKENVRNAIQPEVEGCINSLERELKSKGYSIKSTKPEVSVDIDNKDMFIDLKYNLAITKGDTKNYGGFRINLNKEVYELLALSTSILNYETKYGDADPVAFMALYPNIKVEKLKQGDSSKIYILTNRNNLNKFQFAVRSLVFAPGYSM